MIILKDVNLTTKYKIDIAEIKQYIVPIKSKNDYIGNFKITVAAQEGTKDTFILHLKIKERDKKEQNLISFRIGIEQHEENPKAKSHDPSEPHFEIEYYKREEETKPQQYISI